MVWQPIIPIIATGVKRSFAFGVNAITMLPLHAAVRGILILPRTSLCRLRIARRVTGLDHCHCATHQGSGLHRRYR
jgi:hypothetical protein